MTCLPDIVKHVEYQKFPFMDLDIRMPRCYYLQEYLFTYYSGVGKLGCRFGNANIIWIIN